MEKICRKRQ